MLSTSGRLFLGVDTGGTFTDLVLMDERGSIATAKAPTTPGALEQGVLTAIDQVARARGETTGELLSQVAAFGHGTTQATNALIERKKDGRGQRGPRHVRCRAQHSASPSRTSWRRPTSSPPLPMPSTRSSSPIPHDELG